MLEFKYDTQLLIEGTNLDEDVINDYFTNNFKGDCLLAVGDDELIKIHYHTNEPSYEAVYVKIISYKLHFFIHFLQSAFFDPKYIIGAK